MKKKILIVDDDVILRDIVSNALGERGFVALSADSGPAALAIFKNGPPDAVILDMKMPEMDGIETLKGLKKLNPQIPVIMLSGFAEVPTVVKAVKCGAYDFVAKPPDHEKLALTLRRALEMYDLELEVKKVSSALELSLESQLGKSSAMIKVIREIRNIVQTDFSVIIQGETGTGKSFLAEIIHGLSNRASGPFVRVDIGLIPEALVESELFGYKKGAFTGADKDKSGYMESAHTGTIFIDELTNISEIAQKKLLTFLESKEIYYLGSTSPVVVDARIIAASNQDIRECVSAQILREDLFYRLGEYVITLPPLRERVDDIAFYSRKFLLESNREFNKQVNAIAGEAMDVLTDYSWPGNIRELRKVMRRAAFETAGTTIKREVIERLLDRDTEADNTESLKEAIIEVEKRKIKEALKKAGGNKSMAARIIKTSYRNFMDKLKRYGIG